MFRHRGGDHVGAGYYWNREDWSIVELSREGGILPGNRELAYVRIPLLLFLILAPVLGGLYVVLLPFVGFGMMLVVLADAARQRLFASR